jgi:hypothetical protein
MLQWLTAKLAPFVRRTEARKHEHTPSGKRDLMTPNLLPSHGARMSSREGRLGDEIASGVLKKVLLFSTWGVESPVERGARHLRPARPSIPTTVFDIS